MKKILVPTDFTPIAELGLKLAVQIAKQAQATINLVHFTKHPLTTTFTAMGDANTKIDGEEDLFAVQLLLANQRKLAEMVDTYANDAKIEFSIVDDKFTDGIDTYVQKEQIDLVVMGTSGEETPRELFTGNHTERAIKVSACPVLSVRDGFFISDFRNMVAAVMVMDEEKIQHGLRNLNALAKIFSATVHLVHVVDRATDSKVDPGSFFSRLAATSLMVPYTISMLDGHDAPDAVMEFCERIRAGVMVVIKDSPGGFQLFSRHFSDRVVKEEGRPVLTIKSE
jgi:nucleotide-binding universal stress UspA family protein